jgi:hypothetical protein
MQKKGLRPWIRKRWCIPTIGAEFVWHMEDVLDLYARPYDPRRPQVCFDEHMVQLIAEKRHPLPPKPGRPERFDYEYQRMAGWRHVKVTEHRTKIDFAHCMPYLVDELFPEADCVVLVLDNLNTHTPAALYEAFEPAEAKRILDRLEFHYTPKHGSWLNMVEIEIGVLSEQCLDRRIPDANTLQSEIAAWEISRNDQRATVDWQFTTARAREKLKRFYPVIS